MKSYSCCICGHVESAHAVYFDFVDNFPSCGGSRNDKFYERLSTCRCIVPACPCSGFIVSASVWTGPLDSDRAKAQAKRLEQCLHCAKGNLAICGAGRWYHSIPVERSEIVREAADEAAKKIYLKLKSEPRWGTEAERDALWKEYYELQASYISQPCEASPLITDHRLEPEKEFLVAPVTMGNNLDAYPKAYSRR